MKVQTYDGSDERVILIGMLCDTNVLAQVAPHWQKGMFRSKWSNLLGQWSVDYYSQYNKAPKQHIETVFTQWAKKTKDQSTVEQIDSLLRDLNEQYKSLAKESNTELVVDIAGKHFNTVRLEKAKAELETLLEAGKAEEAWAYLSQTSKLELGGGEGINVLEDKQAIREAFEAKAEPLIQIPGALGQLFGDTLERDGFVALLGREKIGKSRWLTFLAWQAVLQRKKVAFFEVGDMSKAQIIRRFMCRASRRPIHPGTLRFPKKLLKEKGEKFCDIEFENRIFDKGLSWSKSIESCEAIIKKQTKSKTPLLKLSVHPTNSISVLGIKSILQDWDRKGWNADIVIIDYSDILEPIQARKDPRHQINDTWAALRALSQSRHGLVITATQASAASYNAELLDVTMFGEAKFKLAHVTAIFGLNQTRDEKAIGVTRINCLFARDMDADNTKCVHCAGVAAINSPAILTTW